MEPETTECRVYTIYKTFQHVANHQYLLTQDEMRQIEQLPTVEARSEFLKKKNFVAWIGETDFVDMKDSL